MLKLRKQFSKTIQPAAPFNFDLTAHNPSHFPTELEIYDKTKGAFWATLEVDGKLLGYRLENKGTVKRPKLSVSLYSTGPISKGVAADAVSELKYRFELNRDLFRFYEKFKKDKILGPIIRRRLGMRNRCAESLYELLMISIVLQNATVRRTVQMMAALLKKYGAKVSFDGKEIYAIWTPDKLAKATEDELRALKVGYRAKMLKRISESFAKSEINEFELRKMGKKEAEKELLKLYGVGPASVGILLFENLHHNDALDTVPPWEQKIYSKLLFNKKLVSSKKILKELDKRYGCWKKLAAHYIFTDLFWRHKQKKIDWLAKEIRL